jgi:hypothetical protein
MSRDEPTVDQAHRLQHEILDSIRAWPLLEDREIARRVLHLANDCTDDQKAEAMFTTLLSNTPPQGAVEQLSKNMKRDRDLSLVRKFWSESADDRARFRAHVTMIYTNRKAARRQLNEEVLNGLNEVVPIPELVFDGTSIRTDVRYFALSLRASCAFALALLLDESKGLGESLKECRLDVCQNRFLSLPTASGGRPPLYCCREHQALHAAETGAARTARWREKQREGSRRRKS